MMRHPPGTAPPMPDFRPKTCAQCKMDVVLVKGETFCGSCAFRRDLAAFANEESAAGCPPGTHPADEPCRVCDPSLTEAEHERLACLWAVANDKSLTERQREIYRSRAREIEESANKPGGA